MRKVEVMKFFLIALALSWGSHEGAANKQPHPHDTTSLPASNAQTQEEQTPPLPEEDLPDDVIFD